MLLFLTAAFANPTFSVERGLYEAPFSVELTASSADATLRYSLDGSEPSLAYGGPIEISGTRVLRAQEVLSDGTPSAVVTHSYIFVDDIVTSSVMDRRITEDPRYMDELGSTLRDLPWISLVVPAGLSTTEAASNFEWIRDDGGVGVGVGTRRVGGHSLYSYEKTSIRLAFRDDYGTPRLELDIYGSDATGVAPETSFDALTLRGGNHDSQFYLGQDGQHIRNLWMDETQLEMGHVAPHGRFAHLLLNGEYTGLYHVRERFNAAMLADYLGGGEDDWEAVNGGRAFDGSGAAWGTVVANASDFQEARRWLNVDNFLDYMVLSYYAANSWDWSTNHNWIAVGPTQPDSGGFVFQSSDSDICLYYDVGTNILHLTGPSGVFGALTAEGDPDFRMALADAIYRNLEGDGPLNADRAVSRYERLAALAEAPVVAESARWGLGWWDRDTYWVAERDHLLTEWFPYRGDVMLDQFRAAGWYPLGGPAVDTPAGEVAANSTVTFSAGEVWVTTNGEDPRLPGGAANPSAQSGRGVSVSLPHSAWVQARIKQAGTWGPLDKRFYEVNEAPPLILNEWNTVGSDELLDDEGVDSAFGRLAGNGGDWLELVVIEDHADLRGYRLTMQDRRMAQGSITFTHDPLLADLRAGTILTVAEDMPEDPAYDPDAGDWRFHLRASPDGAYAQSEGFDVTAHDWQLTVWDAEGYVRFGPVGEAVGLASGVSKNEVALLAEDPSGAVRRQTSDYRDGDNSTFGSPNQWGDNVQDFSALRGEGGGVADVDDSGADDAPPGEVDADSGGAAGAPNPPGDCACGTGEPSGAASGAGAVFAAWLARRRRGAFRSVRHGRLPWVAAALGLAGCSGAVEPAEDSGKPAEDSGTSSDTAEDWDTGAGCPNGDPSGNPAAAEVCNGEDDDCDGFTDEEPVDGLPFYVDSDGDGYGDDSVVVTACAVGAGATLQGGDCNDADGAVNPGAEESCDGVDRNCDGLAGTESGSAASCAAESCLAIAESAPSAPNGAYWLALPSGTTAEVYCDIEGGGWTLGFLRNTSSTGSQGNFGEGEQDLEALAGSPAEASSSSAAVLGWLDLNAFAYTDLRLVAYTSGVQTATTQDVPRSSLRIRFGEPGYLLYGGDSPYYWCGGPNTYTDGGAGAVNNPEGAPAGCKWHGSLGSGWDFSDSPYGNTGLTLCGGDGYSAMLTGWGDGYWRSYGSAGGSQAIWVR